MEEWIDSSNGSEMLEVGRSKFLFRPPRNFLLSRRSNPPSPCLLGIGTGALIARISSSRTYSSFRFFGALSLLGSGDSMAARLLPLFSRCSFPRVAEGALECEVDPGRWKLYGIPSLSCVTGRRCGLVRSSLETGSAVMSSRLPTDVRLSNLVSMGSFGLVGDSEASRSRSTLGRFKACARSDACLRTLPLLLSFREMR